MTGHDQHRRIARHRRREQLTAPTIQRLAAELAEIEAENHRLRTALAMARLALDEADIEATAHD